MGINELLRLRWQAYWQLSLLLQKSKPFLTAEQKQFWAENGFLVLPGHFSTEQVSEINKLVDDCWERSRHEKLNIVADIFVDTPKYRRVRLHDAPLDARAVPYKMNDLFLELPQIRNLALEDRVSRALFEVLGGYPLLCNSLNLEYGSQQDYHTDSLYMTPPYQLNLAAIWIALEDVHPDAGPLRYYPGSHLIKPYLFSHGQLTAVENEMDSYRQYMESEVRRLGLKEQTFCAKAGDVFIWHSQLFHGGSAIKTQGRTRRSLVLHYFRAADIPARHRKHSNGAYFMNRQPQPVKETR